MSYFFNQVLIHKEDVKLKMIKFICLTFTQAQLFNWI